MTETTTPWIAELRVILVHPNGRRVNGHIAVGQPYTLAGADPTAGLACNCMPSSRAVVACSIPELSLDVMFGPMLRAVELSESAD